MDVKKNTELIYEIENIVDVNSVKYLGKNIWPLIRGAIWSQLFHPDQDWVGKNHKPKELNEIHSKVKYLYDLFNYIKIDFKNISSDLNNYRQQNARLKNLNKIDFLFFSREYDHRIKILDKYYDPHIDPIIDCFNNDNSFIKFQIDKVLRKHRYIDTTFIDTSTSYHLEKIFSRYFFHVKRQKIENFDFLANIVFDKTHFVKLNEQYFCYLSYRLNNWKVFFKKFLRIIEPKLVFLACYYYPKAMALINACKDLNIKTIDIQHGKQGRYHGMYTHWTKIPIEGYDLLPDYFWVWGKETKNNIKTWQPKSLKRNIPIVFGNAWLAKWKNNDFKNLHRKYREYFDYINLFKNKILFSMQPIDKPLPRSLIDSMNKQDNSYIFLIRLHKDQENQLDYFNDYLKKNTTANYELVNSSKIFLYALLKEINCHITCSSTVIYEALYFKVPSLIIHKDGYNLYENYIKKNIFYFAEGEKEISKRLRNIKKNKLEKEKVPYIETDLDKIKHTIKFIIDNPKV